MELFLYLKKEYIDTWINGGQAPIYPASHYNSDIRNGIYTPDENVIRQLTGTTDNVIDAVVKVGQKATLDLHLTGGIIISDVIKSGPIHFFHTWKEYLILCFSTEFSVDIANKFGKNACVKITHFETLKLFIDKQIGESLAKKCNYTQKKDRHHFLKSTEDKWQKEFRIVWKHKNKEVSVEIPKNCCEDMTHLLKV